MKNGDYSSRVHLRKGEAFVEMADDLNELAWVLESDARKNESSMLPSVL